MARFDAAPASARCRLDLARLVREAARDARAAAEVTVTIEQHDRRHVLEVADTGPGVPADALAHLFDRFYRAAPGTQRRHGALGEQRHRTMA
jgi:signal transduction histidine kinase